MNPPVEMTPQQVAQAAGAGLTLFSLDTTLIPGNLRQQVAVLEVVLQGVASGQAVVVSRDQLQVQSDTDGKGEDGKSAKPDPKKPTTRKPTPKPARKRK